MPTPYEILGVEPEDGDAAIKKAYLQKVREFPPEQQGEAFRVVRDAYELIATDKQRRRYRLFNRTPPELHQLLEQVVAPGKPGRPDAATLIAALAEGVTLSLAARPRQP